MDYIEKIRCLNQFLLEEMPEYQPQAQRFPQDIASQRRLLRSLMNIRPPVPLNPQFLEMQDDLLSGEREKKGIVDTAELAVCAVHPKIAIWQGDITRLKADAIVNAANRSLLGCFCPCHSCIDNAIHSAAGLQLREACSKIIQEQGTPEPNGQAKLTRGYNLPAQYVLHTVGPIVQGSVKPQDREDLAACYNSCLKLAEENNLKTVAFCCISTGEFHFPNQEAAEIAVKTVTGFLRHNTSIEKVIFNVFKDIDAEIYRKLCGTN